MNILKNEHIMMFDCDDTLVMWDSNSNKSGRGKIKLTDPQMGHKVYLTPNEKHIDLLKKHKLRGYAVVVWSAAGFEWATEVVKQLKLSEYVDLIMSKPIKYCDDLHAADILGSRVYLK